MGGGTALLRKKKVECDVGPINFLPVLVHIGRATELSIQEPNLRHITPEKRGLVDSRR